MLFKYTLPFLSVSNGNILRLSDKFQESKSIGLERKLSSVPGLSNLNGYGCWCYFDSHQEAKGAVQDIYDSFCRDLHRGYGASF